MANFDEQRGKNFTISRVHERISRKYNVEEVTFRAKFNPDYEGGKLLDMTDDLHTMFESVLANVDKEHSDPNDKARLSIRHSGLERPVTVHCQPIHGITAETVLQR